jgi:histidinol dehydrogenase
MRCDITAVSGPPEALVAELRSLIPAPESVAADVAQIIAAVRDGGDATLRELVERFDTGGADARPVRVEEDVLDAATAALAPPVAEGLALAIGNVDRVAQAAVGRSTAVVFDDHEVTIREAPVGAAAVYVPGGRAPYPSTVVMGVVTARAAGVTDVAVCAPPSGDGEVNRVVLAACRLTGANRVYRMGGAHAIAALAYGTESVDPVDVIVGPGNLWVQEAKRQVSGYVGIDGFAGPSDLLVIADPGTDPVPIALDLLAQAEHGTGTLVVAASRDRRLLEALGRKLEPAADTGAVCRLVQLAGGDNALALAQAFAPEHLELIGPEAEALSPRITRAGCLFVGIGAATAFGDYIAGSNHILPTNGAARFASALSAGSFRRTFTEVRIADGAAMAAAAAPVARAEGFELHAQSMEARVRQNGPQRQ